MKCLYHNLVLLYINKLTGLLELKDGRVRIIILYCCISSGESSVGPMLGIFVNLVELFLSQSLGSAFGVSWSCVRYLV